MKVDNIQQAIKKVLAEVPQLLLEKRLTAKFAAAGLEITREAARQAAQHILQGNSTPITVGDSSEGATIEITEEDIEYVVKSTEKFHKEQLTPILHKTASDAADRLYKTLSKQWAGEFVAQQEESRKFRERLEHRWGKGLGKLRMLLTIVREWSQEKSKRRPSKSAKKKQYDEVMLRLHVRACQVTQEIIVLLENGLADGAMARWRTLHEITIVAAVIAKFGPEIAERYVHYQVVESFAAVKAFERDHKALGYKPITKRVSDKVGKGHDTAIKRFEKKFGEDYGWAAHHLKIVGRERITFARLEREVGNTHMRSPYKMASYNVHASPKGVYFKLGSLDGSPTYLAGASNAGLTDPGQHAAVSLFEITMLAIGKSSAFTDLVVANIISRLQTEIPRDLWRADKKLRRDDKKYRQRTSR